MAKEKLGFEDFIATVDNECQEFVTELHQALTQSGCKLEVKEAKSGFVVSYLLNKKTIANYVFRKKGLLVRIYANHINDYTAFLDTLPQSMTKAVQDAPACKRLLNPSDCNPKCSTGYDFMLQGTRCQKCRYSAFQFLICEESKPFVKAFLFHEVEASSRAS